MKLSINRWISISVFNFCLVAFLGIVMRLKIEFELPFIDQKNIQHAHSHFAFGAWISQLLMVLIIRYLIRKKVEINQRAFHYLLLINVIIYYGLLISFSLEGYGVISIVLSTFSLLTWYAFAYMTVRGLRSIPTDIPARWYIVSIVLGCLSTLGTFVLIYLMATKTYNLNVYLSSVYFYLHFQYNGWFLFACFGLLLELFSASTWFNVQANRTILTFFTFSCIASYVISILWLNLSIWLIVLGFLSTILQLIAWILFIRANNLHVIDLMKTDPVVKYILLLVGFSLSAKFILQTSATVPAISQLVYGFRPVVMAYLHLVFLCITSCFLLLFLYKEKLLGDLPGARIGIIISVAGFYLNELLLSLQGITSLFYILIPNINMMLLGAGLVIITGVIIITIRSFRNSSNLIDRDTKSEGSSFG